MTSRIGFAAALLAALTAGLLGAQNPAAPPADVAVTGPQSPEDERRSFHLPPGFEAELVAAEPYVRKPININFDSRGRLWVTESVEYPFAAPPGAPHRDTVRILEMTTGRPPADEVTTFTSGLNIPIGVLPCRGGAIIYTIPTISRFHDAGDDRACRREVLYGTFGFKDTHGMTGEFTRGFDGWVYACHGYSNSSVVRGADGSQVSMQSGNVYRFRPDGSRVEPFTWGQVNPFGLTFDPRGNLYSCDCHSRPVYQLLRGAYYPSFGKPHDGLGFGPEMTTDDHGSTAIAGIAYYAAEHFPPAYRDTVYIGNVVTNRINHDRVTWHGATPVAERQPDFLVSDDPWFRPVDVKVGPDGALYVADFYNRIIGHYEVPLSHPGRDRERGRIWRIVYRGENRTVPAPRAPRGDWSKATVADLLEDLGHSNLVVRRTAAGELGERGGPAITEAMRALLAGPSKPFQRAHGLWLLEQTGALDEPTLAAAAHDGDAGVRVHAMRVLVERGSWSESLRRLALGGLGDADALVRRCAAEALGGHPLFENVRPLLALRRATPPADTHLVHVVRMALREQLRAPDAWKVLEAGEWDETDRRALADVAPGVHAEPAARYLLRHLEQFPEAPEDQLRYVTHVARFASPRVVDEQLLAIVRGDRAATPLHQLALWKAVQAGALARGREPGGELREWGEELARRLVASGDGGEVAAGLELVGTLRLRSARPLLAGLIKDATAPEPWRTAGLSALAAMDLPGAVAVLSEALADVAAPAAVRERAAGLLAAANRPEATEALLSCLPAAPERLAVAIASGMAGRRAGAERLLDLIEAGKASPRLLQSLGMQIRLEKAEVPGWRQRVARLTQGLPTAAQRFDALLAHRRAGYAAAARDPARGAAVFERHCAVCHEIGNRGARIGPQLDGIGARGFDRLFEDIADPNRNVDQAFRATTLGLASGQVITGLLLREEGQALVLADAQGKEVRVRKAEVEERTVSPLSPMPANLLDQMSEAEFYDLMAYLLGQRAVKRETDAAANGHAGP
jgi:putative heme-binding domain-containing protein